MIGPHRPAYLRPTSLALIGIGGVLGTYARASLAHLVPSHPGQWPWATFAVNLTGALVLGFLLEALTRSGSDVGWRRRSRLILGTGFLGSYTTYSALAVEVTQSLHAGHVVLALGYAGVSVVLGVGAASIGYLAARRRLSNTPWRPT